MITPNDIDKAIKDGNEALARAHAAREALIAKAEAEGLWLYCHYQDLWWSPAELRADNVIGRYRWGPQNFRLRDPREYLDGLKDAVDRTVEAQYDAIKRVVGWEVDRKRPMNSKSCALSAKRHIGE